MDFEWLLSVGIVDDDDFDGLARGYQQLQCWPTFSIVYGSTCVKKQLKGNINKKKWRVIRCIFSGRLAGNKWRVGLRINGSLWYKSLGSSYHPLLTTGD